MDADPADITIIATPEITPIPTPTPLKLVEPLREKEVAPVHTEAQKATTPMNAQTSVLSLDPEATIMDPEATILAMTPLQPVQIQSVMAAVAPIAPVVAPTAASVPETAAPMPATAIEPLNLAASGLVMIETSPEKVKMVAAMSAEGSSGLPRRRRERPVPPPMAENEPLVQIETHK